MLLRHGVARRLKLLRDLDIDVLGAVGRRQPWRSILKNVHASPPLSCWISLLDAAMRFQARIPFAGARLGAAPDAPILKMFERADWTLFRTIEGLQQKAGVPAPHLRRLVLKELADNALDAGATIRYGLVDGQGRADRYFIEDDGSGLDGSPQDIADLFSIARPLRSTKLLRLPQRGQLGNGLRVVAGAVLASAGKLIVVTRNRRISLRPESIGTTTVAAVAAADQPVGTRVEIGASKTAAAVD
jgi:hypothetical protein